MECKELKGEMAKNKVSIENLADLLKIHRNSVANKLNGNSSFTVDEAIMVRDAFFPTKTLEFLFGGNE